MTNDWRQSSCASSTLEKSRTLPTTPVMPIESMKSTEAENSARHSDATKGGIMATATSRISTPR